MPSPTQSHSPDPGVHSDRTSVNSLSSSETQTAADKDNRRLSRTLDKHRDVLGSKASTPEPAPDAEPAIETPAPDGPAFADEAEANFKPKTFKFWSIILSAVFSMFLVALDRTILATAVPQITNEFNSLGDIGWYGSSYMLATSSFLLLFGRIYRFYGLKWVFLTSIVLFEAGSAICGAAPNSICFIIGRAIAGIGSAGITTGAILVSIPMIPLHKRPVFQSMFGLVFGIASIAGPLIGGAFTGRVTWRWCFYMNLPIGALVFALLVYFLESPKEDQEKESVPLSKHIMRLDPLGSFFFIPSMVCLLVALQWGGSTYPWSNWRIIVLFVVFGITLIAFAIVQVKMPESATMPVRVIGQRSMLAGACFMFFLAGAMMIVVYYVPLWFQATKGVDPVKSGIYTIPLVMSLVVSSIISAMFTQRIGYYVPAMIICPCIMAVGEGLMSTFEPDTPSSQWIGYQFLVGFGIGLGMQAVNLAAQTTLPKEDVPTGIAISFFSQQLGGAVFVAVGQTILNSFLVSHLSDIPGLDPQTIVKTGATDLHKVVPPEYNDKVLGAYNDACTRIFLAALALSIAQLLCSFFVEWKSIKKGAPGPPGQGPSKGLTEKTRG